MNKNGPIVIVEDDEDDRDLLKMAFSDLGYTNPIILLKNGAEALAYLRNKSVLPFLVLSDINMPVLGGFELRKKIEEDNLISDKSIPFLFFSTHVDEKTVREAYKMFAQGVFIKPSNFEEIKQTLRRIIEYWQSSFSPGRYGG